MEYVTLYCNSRISKNTEYPNEVPIDEHGVLGSEFFQEKNVDINYVSKCPEIQNKFESTDINYSSQNINNILRSN